MTNSQLSQYIQIAVTVLNADYQSFIHEKKFILNQKYSELFINKKTEIHLLKLQVMVSNNNEFFSNPDKK